MGYSQVSDTMPPAETPKTVADYLESSSLSEDAFRQEFGDFFLVYMGEEDEIKRPDNSWQRTVTTDRRAGSSLRDMFLGVQVHPVRETGRSSVPGFVTVGRVAKTNDIVLEDESVSGFHAVLYVTSGQLHVQDAQSHNGSFLNDKRVPTAEGVPVEPGDSLRFGSITLKAYSAKNLFDVVQQLAVDE